MCIILMCLLIDVKWTKEKSQSQFIAGMGYLRYLKSTQNQLSWEKVVWPSKAGVKGKVVK